MTTSELITASHLSRKALIYIRQSSPQQAISNQESLRMQYALHQRAIELGWPETAIDIIASDLGTTAASADHREGFNVITSDNADADIGSLRGVSRCRIECRADITLYNPEELVALIDVAVEKEYRIHKGLFTPSRRPHASAAGGSSPTAMAAALARSGSEP